MVDVKKYPKFTLTGVIDRIDESSGIGYIHSEDGIERFFVLAEMPPNPRPASGRSVSFTHAYHANGAKAESVAILLPRLNGVITSLDLQTNIGQIMGDDEIKRFFLLNDLDSLQDYAIGTKVSFCHSTDSRGPKAESIKIIPLDVLVGIVNFYNKDRKFGFISGYDGQNYYFHESDIAKSHLPLLLDIDSVIEFTPQLTSKGLRAKKCRLLDSLEAIQHTDTMRYSLPTEFLTSKTDKISGYSIIELGDYEVHASSETSPDEARKLIIEHAKQVGANGLINLRYFKTKGSRPSEEGNGTHYFTIHNFSGRVVKIAKLDFHGLHTRKKLIEINERCKEYITSQKGFLPIWYTFMILFFVLGLILIFSSGIKGLLIMFVIPIIFLLTRKSQWITEIKK